MDKPALGCGRRRPLAPDCADLAGTLADMSRLLALIVAVGLVLGALALLEGRDGEPLLLGAGPGLRAGV